METKAEKDFAKAVVALAEESVETALAVLTGTFVSLTLEMIRRNGHDPDKEIKIYGGNQRDITIHAPKVGVRDAEEVAEAADDRKLTTADDVRRHAELIELASVDFIDENGRIGARKDKVHTVRLGFIDGAVAELGRAEFETLSDVTFKLRPAQNDS